MSRLVRSLALCVFTLSLFQTALRAQTVQEPVSEAFQNGIELYRSGQFDEALRWLTQKSAASVTEEQIILRDYYTAKVRAAVSPQQRISHYKAFILKYPGDRLSNELLKELGHRFTDRGEYQDAIVFYEEALGTWLNDIQSAQVLYWIAEAAAENDDYAEARNYFLRLADDYPRSQWAPEALYARGRLYLTENEYDSSAIAFELLKERYTNDPITQKVGTALGESYYQQGRYEESIEALDAQMVYLDEESRIKALFLMAEAHNYLGNYQEATKDYLQYLNLTKGTEREAAAHYGLGWLYHRQEIYHWAAQSFDKAVTGDNELSRKALYYEAVNYKLGGQYSRSLDTFRSFGERYRSGLWTEQAYYEWAVTAFEGGMYGESIETLLSLIRNQENLEDPGKIYTMLGEAYYANNEFTRAIQAFTEAEKFDNVAPALRRQAQFQKAWILYRNQAFEQALPVFESVYAETPDTEIGKEALFWAADSYYKTNQFAAAANRFQLFIDSYPEHEMIGAAKYSLGWSHFKTGNYDQAVGPFEDFLNNYEAPPIALFPYDTDTQLRIGDAYYAIGDYSNSIEFYNKAIGAEPGGDYAMFQVGNSYYRSGRTFEAVSTFRRLLRIYPFSTLREQAQYNIAYIYLNNSNFTQAIEEFQTVINRYPGTEWAARSQYNIGDAYYNAGEYERSVDAYKKVLENYPRSRYIIEAINGIQYAQLSAGGEDSSSVVLEEFLGSNPQSSTADQLRFRQAETAYETGDYEGAVKEFRQYLRVTNSDRLAPQAYANLGESYRQLGDLEKAKTSYQTIINDYPDDELVPSALTSLGLLYSTTGDHERSRDYFEQLLRQGNRFSQEALIGMADASLALGELQRAEAEYQQALEVNASNDGAKVGLAKVLIEESEYDQANTLLTPVAEKNTTDIGAEAQYLLGRLQQLNSNYEEAIAEYARVKVLFEAFDQWVSDSMYGAAESHIQLGNRGEALAILNEIIETYPGTGAAVRAQKLVDQAGDS